MWSLGVITYSILCGYLPMQDASVLEFPGGEWGDISSEAKDFTRQLLNKNPHSRITASDALVHPWLQSWDISDPPAGKLEVRKGSGGHKRQGSEALKSPRQLSRSYSETNGLSLKALARRGSRLLDDEGGEEEESNVQYC
jgi:serine/threonine protein kinase